MPGLRELEKFKAFSKRMNVLQDEIIEVGQEAKITIAEFRETAEEPPPRPAFPWLLALLVAGVEVLDLSELVFGWTGAYTVVYGIVRLLITAALYIWAFNRLQGIKLINVKRNLLKKSGRRILIAMLANLPIPYIGIILRLFPMDFFFVILVHNDHSKVVQAIWTALGNPKSLDVVTNITRSSTSISATAVKK